MNSSEERAVERRSVHVMIVLCCPSQGENLLLLGNARLKERRKDRVRMSSPFPPPFNNSSSQSGLPPHISDMGSSIKTLISCG